MLWPGHLFLRCIHIYSAVALLLGLQDANESEIKVQVCIYAFDLLYLNGESLVKETFRKRRELLHSCATEIPGQFMFATATDSIDTDTIAEFLDDSVKGFVFISFTKFAIMRYANTQ